MKDKKRKATNLKENELDIEKQMILSDKAAKSTENSVIAFKREQFANDLKLAWKKQ